MSKTSKTFLWLAIATVAVAALLGPRLDWFRAEESALGGQPESAEVLEVKTLVVRPHRLVESFATVGTLRADEQVEIRSEISGILEEVHFEEGARVAEGQLLVEIDDDQLVAERDRALHRVELSVLGEARQQDLLAQGLTSQEEYDLALGQLNVLRAELRLAEVRLEKTRIRAPFAGIVGLRSVSRGAAVSAQAPAPITTLQKVDRVKVEFAVPESYAARLRPGKTVRFRVKGSERDYEAEIYAVEPSVDRETRSLRARAHCANPDGELVPGAFADVELVVHEIENALTVPSLAIIPELGSKKVFVVESGQAVPRRVETGVRSDTEVEITRGLAPGDQVIVSAIQQLRQGLPVSPVGEPVGEKAP